MDYDQLTIVMRHLALEADAKIMEFYNQDDFEVQAKEDTGSVTYGKSGYKNPFFLVYAPGVELRVP